MSWIKELYAVFGGQDAPMEQELRSLKSLFFIQLNFVYNCKFFNCIFKNPSMNPGLQNCVKPCFGRRCITRVLSLVLGSSMHKAHWFRLEFKVKNTCSSFVKSFIIIECLYELRILCVVKIKSSVFLLNWISFTIVNFQL